MSRLNSIRKDAPEKLSNPEIFDLAEQADKLQDLKVLYDSEGGKSLVDLLIKDVVYSVRNLTANYRTASHTELIALAANIDVHLSTAQLLLSSKEAMEILDAELNDALRE